jgi:hypothetical protein
VLRRCQTGAPWVSMGPWVSDLPMGPWVGPWVSDLPKFINLAHPFRSEGMSVRHECQTCLSSLTWLTLSAGPD